MAIKQIKKRNLTTQGFDYTDIGAEAQYVDVSYDANGNIIEDITEPGVVVSSTKSVAEALNDIGPGGGTPEFVGTMAEWIALTPQQKSQYTIVNILDDSETGETVDAVTDGDMRAVTSNAVYDAVSSIEADNIVEISQADYDELTEEEKHNGKAYFIYDAPGGGGASALDDLTDVEITSATGGQVLKYDGTNEVWVNDDEESVIDDTATSTDTTWSSSKINNELNGVSSTQIILTLGSTTAQRDIVKRGNTVSTTLALTFYTETTFNGVLLGTIPVGYRPPTSKIFVGAARSSQYWGTGYLYPIQIIINENGEIYLEGIDLDLANTHFLNCQIDYVI